MNIYVEGVNEKIGIIKHRNVFKNNEVNLYYEKLNAIVSVAICRLKLLKDKCPNDDLITLFDLKYLLAKYVSDYHPKHLSPSTGDVTTIFGNNNQLMRKSMKNKGRHMTMQGKRKETVKKNNMASIMDRLSSPENFDLMHSPDAMSVSE